MAGACQGGYKDLALLMIERGANCWNGGMAEACQGGHKELAMFMIEKGATDWNWGLVSAYSGGHRELILLMMERGANVDICNISLSDSEIYYLVQKGISHFGVNEKHNAIANDFKKSQRNLPTVLDDLLTKDLIMEILSY